MNYLQPYKKYFSKSDRSKGQAVVEFTLVFLLFLAISWIPADFGLALFTGQLAQNASREGQRREHTNAGFKQDQ
jgi:hypothetical protein